MTRLTDIPAALLIATVLGGCTASGGAAASESMAKTTEIGETAVQFAECMRERGYDVPDPTFDEDGLPRFGDIPGVVKGAEFDEARQTCAEPLNEALRAAGVPGKKDMNGDELLAFAACMRDQGIEFPDPVAGQPLDIPKSAINSPAWEPAAQACEEHLPDAWRSLLEPVGRDEKGGGR